MEKNNKFKVLEGGLSWKNPSRLRFKSAWVTDTRLMGVIGLGITWESEIPNAPNFNQFFYFETEELGFERYESYIGNNEDTLINIESSIIGGLGAVKIPIDLEESVYLIKEFFKFNKGHNLSFPDNSQDYLFINRLSSNLTEEEIKVLKEKMCTKLTSKVALANYFLMRLTGRDINGLNYISTKNLNSSIFPWKNIGTFHQNKVEISEDENSCRCESLIEESGRFHIVLTYLEFNDFKVENFRIISDMIISNQEAFLALSHSEFITVFQYNDDVAKFVRNSTRLTRKAMIVPEHNGRTFMIFNPTNDHVNNKNYHLYDDFIGIYHINNSGEFLLASPSEYNVENLETDLLFSSQKDKFKYIAGFEFNEPILLQYFESDFPTFMNFVDNIRDD